MIVKKDEAIKLIRQADFGVSRLPAATLAEMEAEEKT